MRKKIVEYFEEVETRHAYKGYFCSIPEAISIVVLGSICGLRNISQIHQWAESDSVIGFLKEKFGIEHIPCYYWLLSRLKLVKREKWKNLCCIGAIKTESERKGVKTEEWYYYISSRALTSLELLHHARMEWAVESMHWILDVHYLEDFCRIVNRTIQQNLNMLRKFALNMIKRFKADSNSKRPLSQIMFNCLLNPSDICTILEN